MQVIPIQCLTDNYAYIIIDNNSKTIGVVDPSEAEPVAAFLKKKNLKLNYILNTHHHFDHVGGNNKLKKMYDAKVVLSASKVGVGTFEPTHELTVGGSISASGAIFAEGNIIKYMCTKYKVSRNKANVRKKIHKVGNFLFS